MLVKYAGTRITMLNRRRIGEVFGMLLARFIETGKYKNLEILKDKKSMPMLKNHLMERYGAL